MKKYFKLLLGCIVLVVSLPVTAVTTIQGTVTTTNVDWKNAVFTGGFIQPAGYDPVPHLINTKRWTPGIASSPDTVVLSSEGNSVQLALNKVGIEYDFTGNKPDLENRPNNSLPCEFNRVLGTKIGIANAANSNCFSNKRISYEEPMQPFFYVRPIFKAEPSTIIRAFSGNPSGIYRGRLAVQYRYSYKNASGVITYRNMSTTLIIAITYQPNDISSVIVSPNPLALDPNYNSVDQTVNAKGSVTIDVTGNMLDGLVLHIPNDDYSLKESSRQTEIPLNIECQQCSPVTLVTEGVRGPKSVSIMGNSNLISFNLDIGYQNIAFDKLVTGAYTNNFTFIIEASF